ncbi:MAG: hypothetical protein HY814_01065 [Candidatus Riflebacteria bacterium]|nr:hypothetical protein [Candidatus Riflebacteria bacterium]
MRFTVGFKRQLLGRILLDTRAVTEQALDEALMEQRLQGNRERLGTVLLRRGLIGPADLMLALTRQRQAVAHVR